MSTRRYPRTRIYRDLRRLEAEVDSWRGLYLATASEAENPWLERTCFERGYQLEHLAYLIHEAADFAGGVPRIRTS